MKKQNAAQLGRINRDNRMKAEALVEMYRRYSAPDSLFKDVAIAAAAEAFRYGDAVDWSAIHDNWTAASALNEIHREISAAAVLVEDRDCRTFTWSEACALIREKTAAYKSLTSGPLYHLAGGSLAQVPEGDGLAGGPSLSDDRESDLTNSQRALSDSLQPLLHSLRSSSANVTEFQGKIRTFVAKMEAGVEVENLAARPVRLVTDAFEDESDKFYGGEPAPDPVLRSNLLAKARKRQGAK